jgi:hypothetical protein
MHTPELYEIRVASHLSESVRGRFEGLSARLDPSGETVLWGTLDQAGLHGVLIVIRDLGLKLISVNLVGPSASESPKAQPGEPVADAGNRRR